MAVDWGVAREAADRRAIHNAGVLRMQDAEARLLALPVPRQPPPHMRFDDWLRWHEAHPAEPQPVSAPDRTARRLTVPPVEALPHHRAGSDDVPRLVTAGLAAMAQAHADETGQPVEVTAQGVTHTFTPRRRTEEGKPWQT